MKLQGKQVGGTTVVYASEISVRSRGITDRIKL
jgi:hypothetical protein